MKFFLSLLIFLSLAGAALAQLVTFNATVTWDDNSDNEDGFIVEQRVGQGGPFREVGRVSKDEPIYTMRTNSADLSDGQWCFRIRSFNKKGKSSPSNAACKTIMDEQGQARVKVKETK